LRAQKKERAAAPPYNAAAQEPAVKNGEQSTEILCQGGNDVNGNCWYDLSEKDVVIFGENAEDNITPGEFFYFVIRSHAEILGITLNRDQAMTLKKILDNYADAFEAYRWLTKKYPVKARKNLRNKEGV